MKKRNGFTLIEIIFSLIVISMMGYYMLISDRRDNRFTEIDNGFLRMTAFLDKALMDVTTGYGNALGGDCSPGYSYADLSAARARDCVDLPLYRVGGVKTTDGTQSWIEGTLSTMVYDGGLIYFDDVPGTTNEFYMFCDFSQVSNDTGNGKTKALIEKMMLSKLTQKYPTAIVAAFDLSTRVLDDKTVAEGDAQPDGTTRDGLFGVVFRR